MKCLYSSLWNQNDLGRGLIVLFVCDINLSELVSRLLLETQLSHDLLLGLCTMSPSPKPSIHLRKFSAAVVGYRFVALGSGVTADMRFQLETSMAFT